MVFFMVLIACGKTGNIDAMLNSGILAWYQQHRVEQRCLIFTLIWIRCQLS